MGGISVVLKKPYAFLIKHFKLIHLLLCIPLVYLIIRTGAIATFLNSYVSANYFTTETNLAGTYINQATFLGVTSKTKLEFSNDKKVKMTNGTTSENDTYELSGNDLKIKNEDDEVIMRAKLADDRKSFKVKSIAGDIFGILKNIEFTRQS